MKSNDQKVNEMLDQLSLAYQDLEVKKDPNVMQDIFQSAVELSRTRNPDLVATRLTKKLALDWIADKDNFPKAAAVLYNQLIGKANKYDGTAIASILLPLLF